MIDFLKKNYYKIILICIFVSAIVLRIYSFATYRPLWRDECSLAINIYYKSFTGLWGVLFHAQSAPPLFMSICKIFNQIIPYIPEYMLRLFPLLSGLVSIWLFYLLTEKFFRTKFAIILSNILFAINTQLIYFSHEFKQYSTDVAICIGAVLYFSNLNLEKFSRKQIIYNSILFVLLPFLSLPSVFILGAWGLIQILNKVKIKSLISIFLPSVILNFIYYVFTLLPARKLMLYYLEFMWDDGFIKPNLYSIYAVIKNNLLFCFQPCNIYHIPALYIAIGFIISIKRRCETDKLILYTILMVILASVLSIYPIKNRVSLYLLPFIIIYIILPIDYFAQKLSKFIFTIILCIFLFGYSHYNLENTYYEDANQMMQILKNNYKIGDYIFYNDVSDSQYIIYSHLYDFKVPDNRLGVFQLTDYGEDWYYSILNTLPKNNKYWFFYSYDLDSKPVIPFLKNWAHKNGKILFEKEINNKSYLLYLQL